MAHTLTYDRFVIHTIMPAPDWQAVYFDSAPDIMNHIAWPIHALALVTRITHNARTGQIVTPTEHEAPDTLREVVGLVYYLSEGWSCVEDVSNYCGLLPPGMTLDDHQAAHGCRHEGQSSHRDCDVSEDEQGLESHQK